MTGGIELKMRSLPRLETQQSEDKKIFQRAEKKSDKNAHLKSPTNFL